MIEEAAPLLVSLGACMGSARRLQVLEHHLASAAQPRRDDPVQKVSSAEEAVQCIHDGSIITARPGGFEL